MLVWLIHLHFLKSINLKWSFLLSLYTIKIFSLYNIVIQLIVPNTSPRLAAPSEAYQIELKPLNNKSFNLVVDTLT